PPHQLGVAADNHQEIVEVVRDAARELAEGFHLVRLGELLLRALERHLRAAPFAHVMRDAYKARERAVLVADGLDHDAPPELALVAPHPPAFEAVFAFVGGDLQRPRRLSRLLLLFGEKPAEMRANELV